MGPHECSLFERARVIIRHKKVKSYHIAVASHLPLLALFTV